MLLMMGFVQAVVITISNLLNLSLTILNEMNNFMLLFWLAVTSIFPFYLVRKDLKTLSSPITYNGWLIGFVTSFLLSGLIFILGLLDLAIKVYLLRDIRFIANANTVIFGSLAGAALLVILGTFSSWISQLVFRRHHNSKNEL
jgi:hypothetical protein